MFYGCHKEHHLLIIQLTRNPPYPLTLYPFSLSFGITADPSPLIFWRPLCLCEFRPGPWRLP